MLEPRSGHPGCLLGDHYQYRIQLANTELMVNSKTRPAGETVAVEIPPLVATFIS